MFLNNCSDTFEQIRQVNVPCSWSCSLSTWNFNYLIFPRGISSLQPHTETASRFSHVISWNVNILVQQFNLKKVEMGIYDHRWVDGTKSSCKQKHCWLLFLLDIELIAQSLGLRRSVERTTNLIVHDCIHFGSLKGLEKRIFFSLPWPHITDSFTNQFIYGLLSTSG